MFLICVLGNPGKRYTNTRHNIGFKLIDKIVEYFELKKTREDKTKQLFSGKINNFKVLALKPITYMNNSGIPIREIVNFYKINLNNIFVIHDDLDLKLAKIKIKKGGSDGGHNGLLSIDQYLGQEYNRLRIGIDHPGQKDLVSKYVLNKFTIEEEEIIEKKLEKIKKNFDLILLDIPLFLTKISTK